MIDASRNTESSTADRQQLFKKLLRKKGINLSKEASISRRPPGRQAPLSAMQIPLWFINELDPGSSAYNVTEAFRLRGPLDVAALEQSLTTIVGRHEALRTSFAIENGGPVQIVAPANPVSLPLIDRSEIPEEGRQAEARQVLAKDAAVPFDLAKGPPVRFRLVRFSERDHVFLYAMHHIATDGWSLGVFARELSALYEAFCQGRPSPLPELPIQYADFAHWQREWLQGDVIRDQLAYWKKQLAGAPPVLELPLDRPRPAVQTFRGKHETLLLSRELSDQLRTLRQEERCTIFMTLLAALQILLSRHGGQDDVVVGAPIACRSRPELEGLIGFFVNTLVLRGDLSGNPTFRELLARVRETALGAYAHQDVPFEKLVEELRPKRDLSRPPLFQIMLNKLPVGYEYMRLPGLDVEFVVPDERDAKFDMTFYVREVDQRIRLHLVYNADLFFAETVSRFLGQFQRILEQCVDNLDRPIGSLSLLSDSEQQSLVAAFNDDLNDD